jgi:hypothetical protein
MGVFLLADYPSETRQLRSQEPGTMKALATWSDTQIAATQKVQSVGSLHSPMDQHTIPANFG